MRKFWEKYGYLMMLGACLLLILGVAVLAPKEEDAAKVPQMTPRETIRAERTPAPSQGLEQITELAREEEFVVIYPVKGEILRGYAVEELNADPVDGVYSTHDGVDFAGEAGDLVLCAADGTVEKVWVSEKYGNCVEIAHRNGYFSRYMSLGRVYVKEGDRVEVGESVGTVGTCLWENFVHLHFAVRRLTQSLDPEKFMSEE